MPDVPDSPQRIYVYVQSTATWTEDVLNEALKSLSEAEQQRISKIKTPQDRRMAVCSQLLQRHVLKSHSNHGSNHGPLARDNGRPYATGSHIDFNASHDNDCTAVAVICHPSSRVGIDVVALGQTKSLDSDGWWSMVLNDEEQALVTTSKDKQLTFSALWAAKEAFLKCIGTGIAGREPTNVNMAELDLALPTDPNECREYVLEGHITRAFHLDESRQFICALTTDHKGPVTVTVSTIALPAR